MSTLEIRHNIVEQLLRIEDESFLSAIKTILENKTTEDKRLLNDYQKERIKVAREQLRLNRTISHYELQKEVGKWLQGTSLGRHPLIRRRQYYVDYPRWTRNTLRPFIEETLLSPEMETIGLFDLNGLRTVLMDHMEGRVSITGFLGKALTLGLWARQFYAPPTPLKPDGLESASSKRS